MLGLDNIDSAPDESRTFDDVPEGVDPDKETVLRLANAGLSNEGLYTIAGPRLARQVRRERTHASRTALRKARRSRLARAALVAVAIAVIVAVAAGVLFDLSSGVAGLVGILTSLVGWAARASSADPDPVGDDV